ncbi:oligopeptide ABC transporter ATPase [Microbacterium sp. HM58-2]|nr:oligopeptide ABC transporter ATPase [Microbacterium sp. HM58-2]
MSDPRAAEPVLAVEHLDVFLGVGARRTRILNDVSFEIPRGSTLGVVGESGSGKSTLAKTLVGIHRSQGGRIRFDGQDITHADRAMRRRLHREIQMIPQDPYSSLDPRRTIGQTLAEAIEPRSARTSRHRGRIVELLRLVQLDETIADRYPREFSGGQRQRIAIARALAVEPRLVVADEITSALDLSTQAEVLELFGDLKERLGLTVLFVSHNLAVVRQISDQVLVLFHGDVVETGAAESLFASPQEPYTQRLLASVPGGPGFSIEAV